MLQYCTIHFLEGLLKVECPFNMQIKFFSDIINVMCRLGLVLANQYTIPYSLCRACNLFNKSKHNVLLQVSHVSNRPTRHTNM